MNLASAVEAIIGAEKKPCFTMDLWNGKLSRVRMCVVPGIL